MKCTDKDCIECRKKKLCAISFGVAIGVAKGLWMMLLGWAGLLFEYGHPMIRHIATVYSGYAPSFMGGLIGGFWGFIGGFVFGAVVALVYNACMNCCWCMKCCCKKKM